MLVEIWAKQSVMVYCWQREAYTLVQFLEGPYRHRGTRSTRQSDLKGHPVASVETRNNIIADNDKQSAGTLNGYPDDLCRRSVKGHAPRLNIKLERYTLDTSQPTSSQELIS